jgi:hypothetical protein
MSEQVFICASVCDYVSLKKQINRVISSVENEKKIITKYPSRKWQKEPSLLGTLLLLKNALIERALKTINKKVLDKN